MMEEMTLWDMDERFKTKPSTDWKWSFKDYPKEKNGLTVFSCFLVAVAARWDINLPAVTCLAALRLIRE